MMTSTQKYNIAVVAGALSLLQSPGMSVDKLRDLREAEIQSAGAQDEIDRMYYDAIITAIEMMERPMFQ
jgi:hypothetical protein